MGSNLNRRTDFLMLFVFLYMRGFITFVFRSAEKRSILENPKDEINGLKSFDLCVGYSMDPEYIHSIIIFLWYVTIDMLSFFFFLLFCFFS